MKKFVIITGSSSGLEAGFARYFDKKVLSEIWKIGRIVLQEITGKRNLA